MKPNHLLLATIATSVMFFTSCKKTDTTPPESEIETTFKLSADQAIADNLTEDATDVMMGVAEEKGLTGGRGAGVDPAPDNFICATVTVTPQSGFPRTVVIDFGPLPGCTAPNGITRSGIIRVVISDSLNHPQSNAVMTFTNYRVNGYLKEGTITWTNTSTASVKSWRREVSNGKITAPNGTWWLHNGVKEVVQTAGVGTPHNPADDIFRITGHGTTTNSVGRTRSHLITEALQKKWICRWIDKGKIRFEGPNHFAILDFGNGDCNNQATITIDGQVTHNIILPG